MAHLSLVPNPAAIVGPPRILHQEMLRDHKQILQHYFDSYITRRLSPRTLDNDRRFVKGWFENNLVEDNEGVRQLFIWEAMKPVEGRMKIKKFLKSISEVDEDNKFCLRHETVRAYAGKLERLFIRTLESPYIDGLQTISSKYGLIENPFTGVEYPTHSRDRLRDERFFLTPAQILELLIFMREVYPGITNRNSTAGRLYAVVVLITETGMRCVEIINLDALGDTRDIFYDKDAIQTRFGKAFNSSGPLTRVMPLSDFAEITLIEYEGEVRTKFRNHLINPSLFLTLMGKRLSYCTLRGGFTRLIESARQHGVNLPRRLTLHDLRASFATNYLEQHPEKFWKLMELLGHVSPSSTVLYIRNRGKSKSQTLKEARAQKPGLTDSSKMVYNT